MKKSTLVAALLAFAAIQVTGAALSASDKVVLCHKPDKKHGGNTLVVSQSAAAAHFGHGDTSGACRNDPALRVNGESRRRPR